MILSWAAPIHLTSCPLAWRSMYCRGVQPHDYAKILVEYMDAGKIRPKYR